MNEKDMKLLSEFPPISAATWEEQINIDLKGKDYEKSLIWKTNEGFDVRPYYRAENIEGLDFPDSIPGQFPFVRGKKSAGNNWLVRQDIVVTDAEEANLKALEILNKGVTALGFVFKGCRQYTVAELKSLLKGIQLEAVEINFTSSCKTKDFFEILLAFLIETKADPSTLHLSLNHDPIGKFTLRGKFCKSESDVFEKVKTMVEWGEKFPHLHVLSVNGINFNNAGASIVQELGFSLAMGAEYMSRLTDMGVDAALAAKKIRFNFGVGGNYFMELAKLRAARLLWANIIKAYHPVCQCVESSVEGEFCPCAAKMYAHCETSAWNKTIYDPFVNLLRTQTEAMSAVLGGADSLTVLPFDAVYEQPTAFAERIARNQQALLKEEVHLDKIADPAAGSYYIETLTSSIAEQAWKLFLEVQDKGGFVAAFREGFVQSQVGAMAEKRRKAIGSRRDNILGVNQFPNINEQLEPGLEASLFEMENHTAENAEVETLKLFRGAQQLEAIRYATDLYAAKNGRPKVCMLPVGNLAMRKARSQFACNFFASAGYEVIDHNGFNSVEEGFQNVMDAGADIVVLCSSDEEYAELAPELHSILGGKAFLVIAGAPACMEELKAIGILNFINIKTNLLDALTAYNKMLGIN
ncbi:MAG TPA: methylmalonyl-CoA mutase family protein [Prolixibacteraceae bacterium]|nr:methylmalonyl-CoA mutase family protein [Prolixibacteraceae bacterium]